MDLNGVMTQLSTLFDTPLANAGLGLILAVVVGLTMGVLGTQPLRSRLRRELADFSHRLQHIDFEKEQLARQHRESTARLAQAESRVERLRQELQDRDTRLATLTALRQSEHTHHQEQIRLLHDNKEALKNEFSHLANEIFDAKGKRFAEQSQESLTALLNPFREQVEQFRKRVDDIHTQDTRGRTELAGQLNQLRELNTQLNKQADDLTRALQGDKKLQGNWGELQVERILESAGLQRGREYEREANFKDDSGQNRRPDFIIHLPDGKHLIVDSKVSLNDYRDYVGAESDVDRQAALRQHIAAVRKHIQALSDKDYPRLQGMNAPDFVLMFMPIEPAFIAAFQGDPNLFNEGFERNIIVVTPTTLLATLRTVANIWTLERQNENAKKLFDQAGRVYDKMRGFAVKMERLGVQLTTAGRTYEEAWRSLSDGRGSMVRQVEKLQELGAPVKQKLPDSIATGLSDEADSAETSERQGDAGTAV